MTSNSLLRTNHLSTYLDHTHALNREKDREFKEAEEKHNHSDRHLQTIETTVSNIQNQLKIKQDELKGQDL